MIKAGLNVRIPKFYKLPTPRKPKYNEIYWYIHLEQTRKIKLNITIERNSKFTQQSVKEALGKDPHRKAISDVLLKVHQLAIQRRPAAGGHCAFDKPRHPDTAFLGDTQDQTQLLATVVAGRH